MEPEDETVRWVSSARFDDPRNINVGWARVIWAPDCRPVGRDIRLAEGWVLPGGLRTASRLEAVEVAMAMDELMARNGA